MIYPFITHLASFLIGSIPTGYLIARVQGIDILALGSGNTGATNVARVAGKKLGILTLIGDIFKGVIATLLFAVLDDPIFFEANCATHGFASVVGHCYSPFLKGRGGKGVATALGVFAVIAPLSTLIAVIVFALCFSLTRFVSLASISSALAHPIAVWATAKGSPQPVTLLVSTIIALMIVIRHQKNIERLVRGEELRFKSKT